jgi:hypothetical protein
VSEAGAEKLGKCQLKAGQYEVESQYALPRQRNFYGKAKGLKINDTKERT